MPWFLVDMDGMGTVVQSATAEDAIKEIAAHYNYDPNQLRILTGHTTVCRVCGQEGFVPDGEDSKCSVCGSDEIEFVFYYGNPSQKAASDE